MNSEKEEWQKSNNIFFSVEAVNQLITHVKATAL